MQSGHAIPSGTAPRWLAATAQWRPPIELRLTHRNCLYAFLYALIFFGAWLRVDYVLQFNPLDHIWSDPQRHWEQGVEALRDDPMAMTDPVLYQLYIGALGKLTLEEPLLVALYTALLSLLGPWLWYRFLRELQPSRVIALGGWAALSLLPSWIAIYGYFMQETLLLPLLGAALWSSWRCKRKQDLRSFLLMALVWALAGLTRGIAIPLAAVTCTWLWLLQDDKLRKAVYSLLLLALVLGPLAYRAYQKMHIFAPHGVGQMVAIYTRSGNKQISIHYRREGARWNYWFASPSTGEKPLAPLSDWQTARSGTAEVTVDIDKGAEDWQRALAQYPLTFSNALWIARENLLFLFFGRSWPDQNRDRWLDRLNIHVRWLWAPLTLLLLASTALYWRRLKGERLLPSLLLTWIVVQGLLPISVNEGRYRKPGEGLLFAQAALLLAARRRREEESSGEKGERNSAHTPTVAALTASGLLLCFGAAAAWRHYTLAEQMARQGELYLSQLRADYHRQEWGRMGRDRSVEQQPIRIGGHHYTKGLGVHARSETRYRIPSGAKYFHSYFGLDTAGRHGLVEFKVLLDEEEVFSSGPYNNRRETGEILLPLDGASAITLVVDPLGNNRHDHAAWAMARFLASPPETALAELREND